MGLLQWSIQPFSGAARAFLEDQNEEENEENLKTNEKTFRKMRNDWGNVRILLTRQWEPGYHPVTVHHKQAINWTKYYLKEHDPMWNSLKT